MVDQDLLKAVLAPVSQENPTGSDMQYDDDFLWLQKELAKLTNPVMMPANPAEQGGKGQSRIVYEPVDWAGIVSVSQGVLKHKSKDLRVAVWLTYGLLETGGLRGAASGLEVCRGLIAELWEKLYPTRPKARSNAVRALKEYFEGRLEPPRRENELAIVAADEPHIREVLQILSGLDELLATRLTESPVSFGYVRTILEKRASEFARPASTPQQQTSPIQSGTQQSAPTPAQSGGAPPVMPKEYDFTKIADRDKFLNDLLPSITKLHQKGFEANAKDSVPYRIVRMIYWSTSALPTWKVIPFPGVSPQQSDVLQANYNKHLWLQLLQASESLFPRAPYWLDLQWYVLQALAGLGAEYREAYEGVRCELRIFLLRAPDFVNLVNKDGAPVASPDTKQWLRENLTTDDGATRSSGVSEHTTTSSEGEKPIGFDGTISLTDNLKMAQELFSQCANDRDTFLVRLKLSEYLIGMKEHHLAQVYLNQVESQMSDHRLEAWDPGLALQALRQMFVCNLELAKSKKIEPRLSIEKSNALLQRIAVVDPVEAATLSRWM